MQALMRMRFGPYTFLQNPAQLQVENRALQQEERLLSGGVCVTPAGQPGHGDHRQGLVVRRPCAGDGPGAAAAAFARTGYWLFAPGRKPMRAYLTQFDYTCTTARDGCSTAYFYGGL